MIEFEALFEVAYYLSKILNLAIVIGIFKTIEKALLWVITPLKPMENAPRLTRLQTVQKSCK